MSVIEEHSGSVGVRTKDRQCEPELIIKAVHCHHEGELKRILLGLDRQSRVSRFGMVANDNHLIEHLNSAFSRSALIAAAFVESRIRGFVEIYDAAPLGFAEAAFVVEQEWRRRGIGSALLREAMLWVVNSEVPKLRMVFARDNWPMRKMASNARARFDLVFDEVNAEIDSFAWRRHESAQ
jgi:GNAT superfamily N-acetyltransferase